MTEPLVVEPKSYELKSLTIRVKTIWDFGILLMNTMRIMRLNYTDLSDEERERVIRNKSSFILANQGDGKRIILYLAPNKYVSFVFPFDIIQLTDPTPQLEFRCHNRVIDPMLTSQIVKILQDTLRQNKIALHKVFEFDTSFTQNEVDNLTAILDMILTTEPGYIRHDNDPESCNAKSPHRHPTSHFDVHYSKAATYKYGTRTMFTHKDFQRIFSEEADCLYVAPYGEFKDLVKFPTPKKKKKK